jgi:uncharacterized protein
VTTEIASPSTLWAAGIALLLIGLAAGFFAGRRSSDAAQRCRDLERRLDQAIQDKRAYEDEVVEHFSRTAQLLNGLTASYREVHNHLANGAGTLCRGGGPVSLEHLKPPTDGTELPADLVEVRQPLDYAPKSSPDEKGMLNAEFGLERHVDSTPDREFSRA